MICSHCRTQDIEEALASNSYHGLIRYFFVVAVVQLLGASFVPMPSKQPKRADRLRGMPVIGAYD